MPVVAIVGRPNVGKSTLFNLLIGEKRAIVGPQRGITRDRICGLWQLSEECSVDLIDTGGFDTLPEGPLGASMRIQTMTAIRDADVLLCVLDAQAGITPDDAELVRVLRQGEANVIYVANKVDDPTFDQRSAQLYELGIADFVEISALNRRGVAELRELTLRQVPQIVSPAAEGEDEAIRVGILGRPNVGKSLLLNRIIGYERAIVSPEAGTTRDDVDIRVVHDDRSYVFVDTAGIRRRARIDDELEQLSVMRSLRNIGRAHICLLLIDATEGIYEQDRRLLHLITERGRPCCLVINKTDLIDARQGARLREDIKYAVRYMPDLATVSVSALTGRNVGRIYPQIGHLYTRATTRIATSPLNQALAKVVSAHQPPVVRGKRIKFYYISQTGTLPPHFHVVTNLPRALPETYVRYLTNALKKTCGLEGVPLKISFVGKAGR